MYRQSSNKCAGLILGFFFINRLAYVLAHASARVVYGYLLIIQYY